jgi:hypothetical protein
MKTLSPEEIQFRKIRSQEMFENSRKENSDLNGMSEEILAELINSEISDYRQEKYVEGLQKEVVSLKNRLFEIKTILETIIKERL